MTPKVKVDLRNNLIIWIKVLKIMFFFFLNVVHLGHQNILFECFYWHIFDKLVLGFLQKLFKLAKVVKIRW